jgi:hypothetical protein
MFNNKINKILINFMKIQIINNIIKIINNFNRIIKKIYKIIIFAGNNHINSYFFKILNYLNILVQIIFCTSDFLYCMSYNFIQ